MHGYHILIYPEGPSAGLSPDYWAAVRPFDAHGRRWKERGLTSLALLKYVVAIAIAWAGVRPPGPKVYSAADLKG